MLGRYPGFYNYTITSELCNGLGQSCVFTDQLYSQYGTTDDGFYRTAVGNHTTRTRGSWNDASTFVRYTNAVSPLIT